MCTCTCVRVALILRLCTCGTGSGHFLQALRYVGSWHPIVFEVVDQGHLLVSHFLDQGELDWLQFASLDDGGR